MIKSTFLLSLLFCLYGCNSMGKKEPVKSFNQFVYSLSALHENYSIKFTSSDTIFIEERFPMPTKRFYSIFSGTLRDKLDSLVNSLSWQKMDSAYFQENLHDAAFIKFYLKFDKMEKTVSIYGNDAPPEIYQLAAWLDDINPTLVKYEINREIDFGDLSGVDLPPPPPPLK